VLFFASTTISVGDGKNTPFWEANWLNGVSPMMLAPNLYKQAKYKYRTMSKELHNMSWVRNLSQINTQTLIDEFILLCTALSEITPTGEKDVISWKWTAFGEYTAASAYDIQFQGAFPMFNADDLEG
jgi:hypothetical protein